MAPVGRRLGAPALLTGVLRFVLREREEEEAGNKGQKKLSSNSGPLVG